MKHTTNDIAWLAGLLEGEGSFSVVSFMPKIQLSMTDEDIVQRAASILGTNVTGPYKSKQLTKAGGAKKPVWYVNVTGSRAAAWLMTIYTLMGGRRQQKIYGVLAKWKESAFTHKRDFALCHPDRKHVAKGKCSLCYQQDYRETNRGL